MKKRIKSFLALSISGFCVFLLVISIHHLSCNRGGETIFGSITSSPLRSGDEVSKAGEVQKSFEKIYEIYRDSVVFISTEQTVKMPSHPFFNDPFFKDFFGSPAIPRSRTRKRTGLGTGFILSEDGYICTNHHVIARVDKIKVKINNEIYDAKVVGTDDRTDIALLKIKSRKKLKPVYIGDSDSVKVGDWAIAIGNPFGLDKTFTVGVISATGRRDVDLMGTSQSHIQTDASINPGNSGGPLINIYGEVIGINRMIYSRSGGNMGIGFAIPVNQAKIILKQLKKHKKIKRGFIGVQIVPLTEEYARRIGLEKKDGALVGGVVRNSPAERSGMNAGDVIIRAGNKKIKNYIDLVEQVEKTPVGKSIKIVVWRKKSRFSLFVTVGERP